MMVGSRIYDLYARPKQAAAGKGARAINPDLQAALRQIQDRDPGPYGGRGRAPSTQGGRGSERASMPLERASASASCTTGSTSSYDGS